MCIWYAYCCVPIIIPHSDNRDALGISSVQLDHPLHRIGPGNHGAGKLRARILHPQSQGGRSTLDQGSDQLRRHQVLGSGRLPVQSLCGYDAPELDLSSLYTWNLKQLYTYIEFDWVDPETKVRK